MPAHEEPDLSHVVEVELVRRPGDGPEAARSHASHRALKGPPGLQVLEIRADTCHDFHIDARVALHLPHDTLCLMVGLDGRHEFARRERGPAVNVSPDEYSVGVVGDGRWHIRRHAGHRERLMLCQLSSTWLQATLGDVGLAAPFVAMAEDRGGLGFGGASLATSPLMRRVAVDLLACPYRGDVQRLAVAGKTLELLAACARDLGLEPGDASGKSAQYRALAHAAREVIAARLHRPPSLPELATELNTDPITLGHACRDVFGQTVAGLLAELRLDLARDLLVSSTTHIKQIAADVGYGHVTNFTTAFARRFGMPPAKYRQRHVGNSSP